MQAVLSVLVMIVSITDHSSGTARKVIAFARRMSYIFLAQPQANTIEANFVREVWIAGKVVAELQDRNGRLVRLL